MIRISIFLLLFSATLIGKEIHIDVNQGRFAVETVDPSLKVWYLQHYIFRGEGIDPKRYTFAQKTATGFVRPKLQDPIGNYGASRHGPVLLYIVEIVPTEKGEELVLSDLDVTFREREIDPKKQTPAPPPTPSAPPAAPSGPAPSEPPPSGPPPSGPPPPEAPK